MRDGTTSTCSSHRPSSRRTWLARRPWHLVESEALERGAPGAFTVNAGLAAVPVYRRFGFEPDGSMRVREGVTFLPMRSHRAAGGPC